MRKEREVRVTNALGLPEPFVQAAVGDGRHVPRPKTYSVTQMLKGVRQVILERRHGDDIEVDAADSVWAVFGTAIHKVLEESMETPDQLKEGFVELDMGDGYRMTGIFDLYDDATGTVIDYKSTSVWKAVKGELDDYRQQLLIYALILRKMGFEARRGQVVALLKDHSKAKARHERGYPKHPVHVETFDFADEDFERCETFLRERFAELAAAEGMADDEIPVCAPEERWARPDQWAVMRRDRKRAVRLYDDKGDAHQRAAGENRSCGCDLYYVEERPGTDGRCPEYCSAAPFCSYWRERYGEVVKHGDR